nr:MAG TPA: hypothetical protein [Caudoviricetes sp.]
MRHKRTTSTHYQIGCYFYTKKINSIQSKRQSKKYSVFFSAYY